MINIDVLMFIDNDLSMFEVGGLIGGAKAIEIYDPTHIYHRSTNQSNMHWIQSFFAYVYSYRL